MCHAKGQRCRNGYAKLNSKRPRGRGIGTQGGAALGWDGFLLGLCISSAMIRVSVNQQNGTDHGPRACVWTVLVRSALSRKWDQERERRDEQVDKGLDSWDKKGNVMAGSRLN